MNWSTSQVNPATIETATVEDAEDLISAFSTSHEPIDLSGKSGDDKKRRYIQMHELTLN